VRANMFTARNKLMREILERAVVRGDIPVTALKPHLSGVAPALVHHHFLICGAPIPDELLRGIVDDILLPLRTVPAAGAYERVLATYN
jgi:Tetracyclin repressor-like, C-terminal domain